MTRTYTLNTEWMMNGQIVSSGGSIGEVITKAFKSDSLPEGSYADDSFDIRLDYIEIRTDETAEILGCERCGKPLRIITREELISLESLITPTGDLKPEPMVTTNSLCDACGAEHTIIYEEGLS